MSSKRKKTTTAEKQKKGLLFKKKLLERELKKNKNKKIKDPKKIESQIKANNKAIKELKLSQERITKSHQKELEKIQNIMKNNDEYRKIENKLNEQITSFKVLFFKYETKVKKLEKEYFESLQKMEERKLLEKGIEDTQKKLDSVHD